jgi:glycosyltransferase involved in cell wall biosynthesis
VPETLPVIDRDGVLSPERLSIGIAVTNLPEDKAGGAQIQAARMAMELAKHHDVTLFSREGRRSRGASLAGVRLDLRRPFPVPWLRLLIDSRRAASDICDSSPRIDAMVCYQTLAAGLAGAMARERGVPFLVYIHGRHEYRIDRWNQFRLFAPRVYAAADRILVHSSSIGEEVLRSFSSPKHARLQQHIRDRLRILPNGVEQRAARAGAGSYLLFVGRLIPIKALDVLLSALRTLPPIETRIIGDGPERERLERSSADLPVRWLGTLAHQEVIRAMEGAMALLLPSRTEVFPNVIMEAMSLGVPVIASRIGGVPDLVDSGKTGILISPANAAELADAIRVLINDESIRREMGQRAHAKAAQFQWPNVADRLVTEVKSLLSESAA